MSKKVENETYLEEQRNLGREYVYLTELPHPQKRNVTGCSQVLHIKGSIILLSTKENKVC